MDKRIIETLEPICRRQRALLVLRWSALGLFASSILGIALGGWRWGGPGQVPLSWSIWLMASGPLVGAIIGLARGRGYGQAASAVDSRYNLKDRVVTALDFSAAPSPPPSTSCSWPTPRSTSDVDRAGSSLPLAQGAAWAVGACLVALALLHWPRPNAQASPAAPSTR
ncbi:MAG: hypothetical protein WKF75_06720 [Singulisphaera sp.]